MKPRDGSGTAIRCLWAASSPAMALSISITLTRNGIVIVGTAHPQSPTKQAFPPYAMWKWKPGSPAWLERGPLLWPNWSIIISPDRIRRWVIRHQQRTLPDAKQWAGLSARSGLRAWPIAYTAPNNVTLTQALLFQPDESSKVGQMAFFCWSVT